MSDNGANVYHILAFVFEGKDKAKEVLKEAKKDGSLEGMKVLNSVIIRRDEEGKVKFSEIKGLSKGKGLKLGAGAGLILGVLGTGGLLLPIVAGVAGAKAGKAVANRHDKKELSKEMLEITEAMSNDSSAVMALLQDKDSESMINDMAGFNANVITVTLGVEEAEMVETMIAAEFEIDVDLLEDENL